MTVSPEQRFTAKARRGYSKEYLNQVCNCGCARAAHKDRAGSCICGDCATFGPAAIQPNATGPKNFNFGRAGAFGEPRLPAGLREILEEAPIVLLTTGERDLLDAPAPAVVPREGTASRCPYCLANDFETIPAVKCATCNAWQHSACVTEAGRCSACSAPWPV